eukprot:11853836-Alexandrium_andersonii.AAC.1
MRIQWGINGRFQRDCSIESVCGCTGRSAHCLSQESMRIQWGINKGSKGIAVSSQYAGAQ